MSLISKYKGNLFTLNNKVAIIAGASRGIGLQYQKKDLNKMVLL